MNKNFVALSSLAMDLKRVALAYHNGAIDTANRFYAEAIKRRSEVDQSTLKPYLRKLLIDLDTLTQKKDRANIADDALMYSTLFQNASLHWYR